MEIIDLLRTLQGFDYSNLNSYQKELIQRNCVRFVLDLMKTQRNNRLEFLRVLWIIPSSAYHQRDRQRLAQLEPQISTLFEMAKFSNRKYSVVALAREINKYYNFHSGVLKDFFLDIFHSAWDGDLRAFKILLTSSDKSLEDLAFLFLMSLDKKRLSEEFCYNIMKWGPRYCELVGKALLLEYFQKEEPLTDDDLHLFCIAHVYMNKCRPILKYYDGVLKRATPEQAQAFLLQNTYRRGFEPHALENGKSILKKHANLVT